MTEVQKGGVQETQVYDIKHDPFRNRPIPDQPHTEEKDIRELKDAYCECLWYRENGGRYVDDIQYLFECLEYVSGKPVGRDVCASIPAKGILEKGIYDRCLEQFTLLLLDLGLMEKLLNLPQEKFEFDDSVFVTGGEGQ